MAFKSKVDQQDVVIADVKILLKKIATLSVLQKTHYILLLFLKIKRIIQMISTCADLKEATPYFDILEEIQELLATLLFLHNIAIPNCLEMFIRECDRLDDNWLRNYFFEKIKLDQQNLIGNCEYIQFKSFVVPCSKLKLYWLLNKILLDYEHLITFCDLYLVSYNIEVDYRKLTQEEAICFKKIDLAINNESPFESAPDFVHMLRVVKNELRPYHHEISQLFKKDDKYKLYWLIDEYLLESIDFHTFCNEFVDCYNNLDTDLLEPYEFDLFRKLNPILGSFSTFANDFQYDYTQNYTVQDVQLKIELMHSMLKQQSFDVILNASF